MFTPHGKGDVKLLCLLRSVVKFRTFSSWSKPTITQSAIKSKSLAIKLPDLTKREEIFIQHQVDILSDPTCLRDVKELETEGSSQRMLEKIFPSSKELRNLVACTKQIQTYYPNFKVPRRKTDHYKHHMKSPILSERIASGLRFCGVNEATLLSNPEWVLFSNSSYLEETDVIELASKNISDLIGFARTGDELVRGSFILNYLQRLQNSLTLLKMEEVAETLSEVDFSQNSNLTLKEFYNICNKPVIERIACIRKLPPRATLSTFRALSDKNTEAVSPLRIARNFYISEEILKSHPENFRSMRVYWYPEPMETMIYLNSFYETLTEQLSCSMTVESFLETSREVCCQSVLNSSKNLPVSIRCKILLSIGFSNEECREIVCSLKCQKYSDSTTNLVYTSVNFIEEMRSRLKMLRDQEISNNGLTAPEMWSMMTNWSLMNSGQTMGKEALEANL